VNFVFFVAFVVELSKEPSLPGSRIHHAGVQIMTIDLKRCAGLAAAFIVALPLAACSVNVQGEDEDRKAVDINTPVGDVSVRSGADAPGTGLPVYPGARPLREGKDHENANVNIDTAWFGVKVAAATFESGDRPEMVADFYRREMRTFGEVTECRGDIDFKGHGPVCKERHRSESIQLAAGSEEHHRLAVVKPRGSGSELALVHVQTRD